MDNTLSPVATGARTDNGIEQLDEANPEVMQAVIAGLNAHSATQGVVFEKQPLTLCKRDAHGTPIAGLYGESNGGWLFVKLLWVSESLRGQGVGRAIMVAAEAAARARNCVGIYLDTFSFQARSFYEALGYSVFGTVGPFWREHQRIYLAKTL